MKVSKRPILVLIVFFGLVMPGSASEHQTEYTMKAVFLEHFTRFIEWPESSRTSGPSSPFCIAVIGENPFGSILDQIYEEQKMQNRDVDIQYISNPQEIPDCRILYISGSNKENLEEILAITRNKPILTVGDTEGFAEKGVLINFYMDGSKIKFEINEKAVHESGLVMSYRLLSLAKLVDQKRKKQ